MPGPLQSRPAEFGAGPPFRKSQSFWPETALNEGIRIRHDGVLFAMKPSNTSSLKSRPLRSAGHAAAAAGVALMTANAGVVYVDDLNTTVSSATDKSGTAPLGSAAIPIDGTPAFTANLQSGSPLTISIDNRQNGFAAYGVGSKGGNPAVVFSTGETIPPPGPTILATDYSLNLINFYNALAPGESAYIGFAFNPTGSQELYGWAEFEMGTKSTTSNSFTLTRYAYEDSGAGIQAGQIPEPSGALLVMLAGAAGSVRRRR